jgi:hypothetical protein
MGERNNNQQVAGPAYQQQGMLGAMGQAASMSEQQRDASANMAYPWMQAGKWSSINGGGFPQPQAGLGVASTMANTDSAVGGPGGGAGTTVPNNGVSGPGVGAPAAPPPAPSLGAPMGQGGTADQAVQWFDNYYQNAPVDSMGYPVWPSPADYPSIAGSTWGTPTGNNTPSYLYGVPAPSQQQMQSFVDNRLPVTERPGNDVYYSLQSSLGRVPTAAEAERAVVNNNAASAISTYLTDPIYQRVGPGGLTVGQQQIMNLQKGGLLPKDLLL